MTYTPNYQLVGGVYLPAGEDHLVDWMMNSKHRRMIDGKLTYQYNKLEPSVKGLGPERRRVAVDVGAHVGLWSMWLQNMFQTLHAFEPHPFHMKLFNMNVEGENVIKHQTALGNKEGRVSLISPENESSGNTHVSEVGNIEVPISRLDSFQISEVDYIKVDCEGYELYIIEGAEQTIKSNRPRIIVEQKRWGSQYFGQNPCEAVDVLKSWGMTVLKEISGDFILDW